MSNFEMEDRNNKAFDEQLVDVRGLLNKFLSKWHYFAISVFVFFLVAFGYLQNAPRIYQVKSTVFVKEHARSPLVGDDFFTGMEMFSSDHTIENEIGLLSSFNLVQHTLRQLDFGVEYFESQLFGSEELYHHAPFLVNYDSLSYQITEEPFYIHFITKDTFEIEIDAENFYLHQPTDVRTSPKVIGDFSYRDTLAMGEASDHPYLNFTLIPNPRFDSRINWVQEQPDYHFAIRDLKILTEEYLERLTVKKFNQGSSILELIVEGSLVEKQRRFLNAHTKVYLNYEVEQKNLVAQRTIDFIDRQLSKVADSLKGAEQKLESFQKSENVLNLSFAAEQAAETLKALNI